MELIEYNEIKETALTIEKEAIFISEDLGNDKSFDSILMKFDNYRFYDFIRFLNEQEYQSYSSILFTVNFIKGEVELKFSFLTAILEILDRDEIEYRTSFVENLFDKGKKVDMFLEYEEYKVIVKAKMKIKFYKNRRLSILDQYQDAEYEEQPAIIESAFTSDNCSVCLSKKPNILNIPCLHLAICCSCEEKGKLRKCPTCRRKITKKIKI